MKGRITALAAMGICALSVSASAQVAISQDGRPERMAAIRHLNGLNSADRKMIQAIYLGNSFEIRASEIAVRRGQSTWVREYAKEMIREHQMAQNELKLLAHREGAWLRNNLSAAQQNQLRMLETSPASMFDARYRQVQLDAHGAASKSLQQAIKYGKDEMVRSYAIKMLPAVKDHYALAVVRRTMMGPTATKVGV